MRNLSIFFLIAACASLAACSTPNREGAAALAADGQKVALGLHSENSAAITELRKLPDQLAVYGVVMRCKKAGTPETCRQYSNPDKIKPFIGNSSKLITEIVDLMNKRARAYLALHAVYGALAKEAAYDARAERKAAVHQLVESVGGFAKTAAAAAGAAPVGEAAIFAVDTLAQAWAAYSADAAQTERLEEANKVILAAVAALRAGMAAEQEYQATARGLLGVEPSLLMAELTEEGFVPYAPVMQSMMPANTALPADLESKIRQSLPVRTGLLAALKLRALRAFDVADQNYAVLLASVDALEQAHHGFRADQPFEISDAAEVLSDLATAVNRWNELKEQDKAAAEAAKQKNEATKKKKEPSADATEEGP